MVDLVAGLILVLAGGVLSAVGYVHRTSKKSNRERKREIDNLDERLSSLEANMYGHEKGTEGYIVSTEAQFKKVNEKLDRLQGQMEQSHNEAKTLLGEIVRWIEDQNGDDLNIDYERTIEFEDKDNK